MNNLDKTLLIGYNYVPILIMILLIRYIENDYWLTATYSIIILISLSIHYEEKEATIFTFGAVAMIISETLFILSDVEVFVRNSLLGIMPLWLPLLWGYAFIAIKRTAIILQTEEAKLANPSITGV